MPTGLSARPKSSQLTACMFGTTCDCDCMSRNSSQLSAFGWPMNAVE